MRTPDDWETRLELARALVFLGKRDAAIAEAREAIRLKPDVFQAHGILGRALREQGRLDEAIAEYRAIVRMNPNVAEAHNELGIALAMQGKAAEAFAEFRSAVRISPEHANAHDNLGRALFDQGKLDEAVVEYRTSIRIKPDDAGAHTNLDAPYCTGRAGRWRRSPSTARQLSFNPDYADANSNLGGALKEQGKLDESVAECRTALRLKPDCPEAHSNLGGTLKEQRKLDEAVAEFRAALRLTPDCPEAHYGGWAKPCTIRGIGDEAIAEVPGCRLRSSPLSSRPTSISVSCWERRGRWTRRLPSITGAPRHDPDHPEAHYNPGRRRGQPGEAGRRHRRIPPRDPNPTRAHQCP